MKFTELGAIRLGTSRSDGELLFEVRDTGKGIPPERLRRVFDRYWTVGASEGSGGHGLGLYIAKGIIEAHGGTDLGKECRGAGDCVLFTLPIEVERRRRRRRFTQKLGFDLPR